MVASTAIVSSEMSASSAFHRIHDPVPVPSLNNEPRIMFFKNGKEATPPKGLLRLFSSILGFPMVAPPSHGNNNPGQPEQDQEEKIEGKLEEGDNPMIARLKLLRDGDGPEPQSHENPFDESNMFKRMPGHRFPLGNLFPIPQEQENPFDASNLQPVFRQSHENPDDASNIFPFGNPHEGPLSLFPGMGQVHVIPAPLPNEPLPFPMRFQSQPSPMNPFPFLPFNFIPKHEGFGNGNPDSNEEGDVNIRFVNSPAALVESMIADTLAAREDEKQMTEKAEEKRVKEEEKRKEGDKNLSPFEKIIRAFKSRAMQRIAKKLASKAAATTEKSNAPTIIEEVVPGPNGEMDVEMLEKNNDGQFVVESDPDVIAEKVKKMKAAGNHKMDPTDLSQNELVEGGRFVEENEPEY